MKRPPPRAYSVAVGQRFEIIVENAEGAERFLLFICIYAICRVVGGVGEVRRRAFPVCACLLWVRLHRVIRATEREKRCYCCNRVTESCVLLQQLGLLPLFTFDILWLLVCVSSQQ